MTQIIKHVRAPRVNRLSQPRQGRSDQSTPPPPPFNPSTSTNNNNQLKPGRQRSAALIGPCVLCGYMFIGLTTGPAQSVLLLSMI